MRQEDTFARWLGLVIMLAVATDLCLALPMALYPNAMLSYLDLPLALERPALPRLGAILLLLSAIPAYLAILDPGTYRLSTRFAVALRWAVLPVAIALESGRGRTLTVLELAFAVSSFSLLVFSLLSQRKVQKVTSSSRENHVEVAA